MIKQVNGLIGVIHRFFWYTHTVMNRTLISIVVPVYNVEQYIEACMDSLLAQTYTNIEILAVNDGSKDHSLDLLNAYAKKDDRVIVLNKENGGLSDARNYGMKHMKGEYVAFVDSDDLVSPRYIEAMYEAIVKEDLEIAVCDMQYFYEDSSEVKQSSGGSFTVSNCKETPSLIALNNSSCNKLFKKELFDDVEFPVGWFYEDLATIPLVVYKAKRIGKVNEALYDYRQRSGSIAHTASQKIFDIYKAIQRVEDYVKNHGNEEAVLKEIKHLYVIHGLDLTTLRIKDFDDQSLRKAYLTKNMECMNLYYKDYTKDEVYQSYGLKKKLIFFLLRKNHLETVLRLYDR